MSDPLSNPRPLPVPGQSPNWARQLVDSIKDRTDPVRDMLTKGRLSPASLTGTYATHERLVEVATGQEAALTDSAVTGAITGVGNTAKQTLDANYAAAVEVEVDKYPTIQAAINAAQALAVPVVVKFGRGPYTLTAPLNVTAPNITLDFGRARLIITHSGVAINITGTAATPLTGIVANGGLIDLNNTAASGIVTKYATAPVIRTTVRDAAPAAISGNGVQLEDCTDPTVDVRAARVGTGVTLNRSPGGDVFAATRDTMRDGVNIYNGSHDATVRANVNGYNTSGDGGRAGVHVYGSNGVAVLSPRVESGTVGGTPDSPKVRFRDSQDFTLSGGVLSGPLGGGVVVTVLSDIGTGGGGGTITGVTIKGSSGYGIRVALGTGGQAAHMAPVTISGNTVSGVRAQGPNAGYGIIATIPDTIVNVPGNTVYDCDGEGIQVACTATVTGNTVHNVGKGTLGSKTGIYVSGGEAVVEGNTVVDTLANMSYCLRVYTGAKAWLGVNNFKRSTAITIWNQGTIEQTTPGAPAV